MSSFDFHDNKSKRKKNNDSDSLKGIYGITKPGKYYFPGKITSACFDENGLVTNSDKQGRKEELYDDSVDREYDPQGMYSGLPIDQYDVPVQDADDL